VREDVDWLLAPLPSGRHGLSREEVIRSQRLRLLNAAVAVAGVHGYQAMTVSAVIAHASVSRKTFYELFADREDCFLAAYGHVVERGLTGIRAAYAIEAPWPRRVRGALAWVLESLAERPREARVVFVEAPAAGPRALALRDEALRDLAPLLAPGFEEALPDSAAVPRSMPAAIVGAVGELIGARVRNGDAAGLPGLLSDALFCALAPFTGPRAAAAEAALDAGPRVRSRQPAGA
jgi:AcrR family transcriptional regulator